MTFPSYRKATKQDGKEHIRLILLSKKIPFVQEYQGIPGRKFRFDYAIPSIKLCVEYEGIMSTKARHTSVTGYTKDCEKYNLSTINGWRVLRYTVLNYKDFEQDLNQLLLES